MLEFVAFSFADDANAEVMFCQLRVLSACLHGSDSMFNQFSSGDAFEGLKVLFQVCFCGLVSVSNCDGDVFKVIT
jgi:hypothetical protein